jgi:hypothetical protein
LFIFELKDEYIKRIRNCPYKFPKFKYTDLNIKMFDSIMEHYDTFNFFDGYKFIEYETEHYINIDGIPFKAIPDMVGYDLKNKFIIGDHKISKLWLDKEIQKKKRQLYTYSLAIINKYNQYPDHFEINFFKENKIIKYKFIDNELDETKKWINDQIELIIKEKEFIPRCELVKDKTTDFYANYLCNHRKDCEYRPHKNKRR